MRRRAKSRSADQVRTAAAMLDIGEHELFAHAFEHWHGRKPGDRELERAFLAYMFLGRVPYWVRGYCREILTQASRNDLDPISFGVLPRLKRQVKLGLLLLLVVNVVFWGLVLLAEYGSSRALTTLNPSNAARAGLPWIEPRESEEGGEQHQPGREPPR